MTVIAMFVDTWYPGVGIILSNGRDIPGSGEVGDKVIFVYVFNY